jgi:hypothetical protein
MPSDRDVPPGHSYPPSDTHEALPHPPCASCSKRIWTIPGAMKTLPCSHAIHRTCLKRSFDLLREESLENVRSSLCRLCPPQVDDALGELPPQKSVVEAKTHSREPSAGQNEIWQTMGQRSSLTVSNLEGFPGWQRRLYQVAVPKAEDLARQDRKLAERQENNAKQKDSRDSGSLKQAGKR